MLRTKVKAGSVTNLTDARYFAAWEVEWLGFNLDSGSDDYIDPRAMLAIKEWVDGVKIVGEFNLPEADTILSAIDNLELDQVQVGPFADHATLKALNARVPVVQELVIEKDTTADTIEAIFDQNQPLVAQFILNFGRNQISWEDIQAGHPFNMEQLREWAEEYAILLDINFEASHVNSILETVNPHGICVKGGVEEKVGYKSFDELDDLFEAIEVLV